MRLKVAGNLKVGFNLKSRYPKLTEKMLRKYINQLYIVRPPLKGPEGLKEFDKAMKEYASTLT